MRIKDPLKQFLGSRARSLLVTLFLILLPLVFFWRETLGYRTLGDQDAVFWFFPAYKFVAQQIKSGSLPLWNPYQYSGAPMFAEWQAGALDPINWIYLIETTSRALTLSLEIGFAVALLAAFIYARSVGFSRAAAMVSAVIYGLSGFAVARTLYPGFLHIVALTPFVLYFVERLYREGRWRYIAGGALIIAWQVFAAHPQPLIYSSLLACAYALFCAFFRRSADCQLYGGLGRSPTGQGRSLLVESSGAPDVSDQQGLRRLDSLRYSPQIRFLVKFAVMFIAGAGLSAAQLLPAAEFARQSVRREWPFELFTLHSLHPSSLVTTLFPFFHGEGRGIYRMPYWGVYWHHNEAQIYLGVIALSLAIAGAIFAWRVRFGLGIFWSCVALIGVILAFGKYSGPVARVLYHIPVIGNFRSPNRHWMEVTLAVAFLAGYAVDRLLREQSRFLAQTAQVAAGALTALCLAIGGIVLWRGDLAESFIRSLPDLHQTPEGFLQTAGAEFYLPMIAAIASLFVIVVFTRARRRNHSFALLLALLIVDYHLYAAYAPITNPDKLETLIGTAMPKALAAGQSDRAPVRNHVILTPTSGEFKPLWFYGTEMITGYDPVLNERYKIFSGVDEAGRSFISTMLDPEDQTLDLLNARYVFAPPALFDPSAAIANGRQLEVELRNGRAATFKTNEGAAAALAIVSSLSDSVEIADGDEVAEVEVVCGSGAQWMTTLRAGRDSSDWAYDRPDVRSVVKHSRARVAESWNGDAASSFQAHSYIARLELPENLRACQSRRTVRVKAKARDNAAIVIRTVAFEGTAPGHSILLAQTFDDALGDRSRWREVAERSEVAPYRDYRVFENIRNLPRAWLVGRVKVAYDGDQLKMIRGAMAGQSFDPRAEALVAPIFEPKSRWYNEFLPESGSIPPSPITQTPQAAQANQAGSVNILDRKPGRILIETTAPKPAVLVLSEIAYPGWRASVDGKEHGCNRVDYMLLGVPLSEGTHTVELVYRPSSINLGAVVSITTALCLVLGVLWGERRTR